MDTNGNVYVADSYNYTIRKITPVGADWVTTTIAGLAGNHGSADGTNSAARFLDPEGIAVDANGNLYVADYSSHTIRKIAPVGTTNWVTTTIAGTVTNSGSADGTNSAARFNFPEDVAVDGVGNLYVADEHNHTIRKIAPVGTNWVTTTIAGLAGATGSTDGTNSTARFNYPARVAVDSSGNLYVADAANNAIRKVTPVGANWVTITIGGLAGHHGIADGTNSDARFYYPEGVAADANGNLYVADTLNHTIRQGVPWGTLTITKETAKVNFNPAKTNDSCAVTATFNHDASYNLTNLPVSLDIGGVDVSFNLDAKGKGRGVGTNATCKLSYKKRTGPWTFTASLKKGSWATPWGAYGLTNATIVTNVTLPVTLAISNDVFYSDNKTLHYKAKLGKSGSAK